MMMNKIYVPVKVYQIAIKNYMYMYNSLIFETEVKGEAYSVTLYLYRRALAGAIHVARGLSLHKRSRLHILDVRVIQKRKRLE